ncbi:MAG: hypothetical protein MJZ26_02540 [Fibrobacter sp.]|nr:hypothetical protein [Fibrobacter sp.]
MSKSKKKNNEHNNYKIEQLEIREMMSADAPIDFSDVEEIDNRLGVLYFSLESDIENSVSSQTNDVGYLIKDEIGNTFTNISDLLGEVSADIKANVQSAFANAKAQAVEELEDNENSVNASTLLGYLEESLPQGFSTTVVGSKITVGYDLVQSVTIGELGLNLDYLDNISSGAELDISAHVSFDIDLNADNDNSALENGDVLIDSVSISNISAKIDNLGVNAKFMNLGVSEIEDTSETEPDFKIEQVSGNLSSTYDLEFALTTDVFSLANNSKLGISKDNQGNINVDFPDVLMNNDFTLDGLVQAIDVKRLPFLKDFKIPFNGGDVDFADVGDVVKTFNEYWARISVALNGIVDASGEMNFNKLQTFFGVLIQENESYAKAILNTIKVYESSSPANFAFAYVNPDLTLSESSNLTEISLGDANNKKTLTLEFSPLFGFFADKIDFKLFSLSGFDVNAILKVDVEVWLDTDGKLKFGNFALNNFELKITKNVNVSDLQLGLFETSLDGTLEYVISADNTGLKVPTLELHCTNASLNSGSVKIADEQDCNFSFNMIESVWEFPEEFKQYLALSAETLANNVAIYLNSLRTSLRNLIEDKVNLDFLDGSAGSLFADSIAKIDEVLYGKVNDQNIDNKKGLFKVDNGALVANFNSVENFASVFNTAWNKAFEKEGSQHCLLKYVDAWGNSKTVEEFDSLNETQQQAFAFDHYVLEFTLGFDIAKTLDLNLVDSLGNNFKNVSTYGAVTASGDAGIKFSLDVNFSSKKINDDGQATKLEDFWGLKDDELLPLNEDYFEVSVTDLIFGMAQFDVLENNTVIDTVSISSTDNIDVAKSVVDCILEDNRVVVTRNNAAFNLGSSVNQLAYAELGLGGSSLQTTVIAYVNDVKNWSSDLTLNFISKDGTANKNLVISSSVLNELADKNIITGVNDAETLKNSLNQYFNLQYNAKSQVDLGMKDSNGGNAVLTGRTIMNTFGLYVVSVVNNASSNGYTIRFGCDSSRIQGYGNGKLDKSAQFDLKDGSNVVYMRVSNALKKTGVIGNKNGLMLERYTIGISDQLQSVQKYVDLSSVTGIQPDNLYDESEIESAKSALGTTLLNLGFGGYVVEQYECEINGQKSYSLGVSAEEYSTFIYKCDVDDQNHCQINLKKYRIENETLVLVETKKLELKYDLSQEYTTEEQKEIAEERLLNLETTLNSSFNDAFKAKFDENTYKIEIVPKQTEFYRAVMSNKFLEIAVTPVGTSESTVLRLNTENCRDLTTLAHSIISAAKKANIVGFNSVAVQGDSIVFGVAKGTSVTLSDTSINFIGSDDFEINGKIFDFETLRKSDSGNGVDFVDKTWSLDDVVRQINNALNADGVVVSLEYFDRNADGTAKVDENGNVFYWDHLEFRSQSDFEIKSLGSSKILDKLGFTAKKATEYARNDYRIVGRTLLGIDWSKLIDFTTNAELNVFANARLDVGQNFIGTCISDEDEKIVLESSENLNFVVNALVKAANENYYKILDVEKLESEDPSDPQMKIVTTRVTLSQFAEGNRVIEQKLTSAYITSDVNATSTNPTNYFCYMGGAVATVGFVDVNLVAAGAVGFNASFDLKKLGDNENANNIENVVQSYELKTPGASILSGSNGKNTFSIETFVDIGDLISENIGSASIALGEDGKLTVDSKLDGIVDKAMATFGSFSAEDLFAILDSLVERLRDIAKKSNVKIPVINKSVSDLVDVSNNMRDVVNKLRTDNVLSLQVLNDRLNKYLKDFGLVAHDGVGGLFENANPFVIEFADMVDSTTNEKVLLFSFNIKKSFESVHQFSFGDDNKGISGNTDLNVVGDFWFSMRGKAVLGKGTFDLNLENAIEFGANVDIVGEKLSFNLGFDNIADVDLLANLITVGSNKSDSYVCAKASLLGNLGQSGLSLKTFKPDNVEFNFAVPVAIMGKLPISVSNIPLGDILLGIGNGDSLSVDANIRTAKANLDGILLNYANYWNNKKQGDSLNDVEKPAGLIEFESLDVKKFFKLVTDYDYSQTSGNIIADFSAVYNGIGELINGDIGWFEKIKLAITGFNKLFDTLESSLNSGMTSSVKNVPVVGNALSGGVDFLGNLKKKVLEPLSNFLYESTGMNAEMVAQKLNELFGTYLRTVNVDGRELDNDWISSTSTGNQTFYREGKNNGKSYAEWYLSIGDTYSFGSDIGFDLGFPGLGLKSDAGVNLELEWSLDFGFGVSEEGGFYFIFNDGAEVHVEANVDISGVINGSLAGLGLEMIFPEMDGEGKEIKEVKLEFGVDLDGARSGNTKAYSMPTKFGDRLIDYSKLTFNKIEFDYDASVDFTAEITVGIVRDLQSIGDAPKFPNLNGNFDFHWNATKGVSALSFNDFQLDMGAFISGVLGPIVSKIQKVVEPLEPLIDFLTTPFPVLDDLGFSYTPLSLAKEFSKGKFDDRMVYAVKDLIEISKKISAFNGTGLKIDLGSMELVEKNNILGLNDNAKSLLDGTLSVSNFDVTSGYANVSSKLQGEASSTLMSAGLNMGDSSWHFIWDNPTDVFKLLLGQDIMLVEYDMPKLSFNFDWSTFVRIYGPLGARLGLSLSADIDLGFGYDTLGIRQWINTDCKDYGCLLNGFYVNDLHDGADIDELSFHGGLTAAAELNAGISAGVGGGVGINVGFNLHDPNKDGKIRLGEMTEMFKEDGLFGFFDVNGAITAKLYAYVDLLFYTKEWNITGDKTLFEFKNERKDKPVMISKSGSDVVANIGSNAANRISTNGINKTLTDDDEILYLKVDGSTISDDYDHCESTTSKLIVNAEKGNDKIILKSEKPAEFDIIINGGDGDDIIDLSGLKVAAGHYVLINGGAGVDHITGAQGLNIIFGDTGTVRVDKEKDESEKDVYRLVAEANVDADKAGGDVILGGSGHDIIFGGAGDDKIAGGDSTDYIFGDGGSWSILTNKNDVVAALHEISNGLVKDNVRISRTDISLDGGKDTLIGGNGDDVIYGGGGDDHIDGSAGNDLIYGEKGHDRILGGSDNDTIFGGEGMDIVFGDRITDGSKDVAAPFAVDTTNKTAAFSQEFIDAQFAKDSPDKYKIAQDEFEFNIEKLNENGSVSTIHVGNTDSSEDNGSDIIYGDEGNDLIFGDDGSGTTNGGADKIYGGIGNDIIDGDGGNDTISGGIDNDLIYGGAGDDIIDGGAGNDMLYGDNGVIDYDSTGITLSGETGNQLGNDKIVFGDNLGLHGELYANAKVKPNANGGNDKITTGPGMDFVDGQGGSDKITVKLLGDSTTNYTNVTDSGLDGSDTLVVEGTESIDRLLLRQNEEQNLGFVALLPITENDFDSEISETVKKNLNSNIERVNYTQGVDVLNVNANGGDDQVYIDGTAKTTNVDGGAGADKFYVGQLYNSDRVPGTSANIQPVDKFNAVKTNEASYLSDGVSSKTKLNIEGGSGADEFVALNNAGSLSMSGGCGDDTFSVYSFRKEDGVTPFDRGAMTIDGGKDTDTLNVRGTDAEDVFVVTKEGMLSDLVAIKAAGVESTQFDAAAGDDMFYVVGNKSTDVTELNGGKGNDTFSMGGLDKEYTLRSANIDGQTVDVKYEFVDANGVVDTSKESLTESFTVVDSDSAPAVFIVENKGSQSQPDYEIRESYDVFISSEGNAAMASFFVGCAGLQDNQTLDVTISAPVPSAVDSNRGDRGFLVGYWKNESASIVWDETITVHPTNDSPVEVFVKALEDGLTEECARRAISISSTWNSGSSKTVLTKSVTSVGVTFAGEKRTDDVVAGKPLVFTEEFIIGASNEFKVNSIYVRPSDSSETADINQELSFYVDGVKQNWTINNQYKLSDNVVTINSNLLQTEKTLTICVRSNVLRVDDSKVYLAYEDMVISSVKVGNKSVGGYTEGCDRYYELNGNVITFYNSITRQPMTIHDAVTVNANLPNSYDWEIAKQTTANATSLSNDLLTISAHNSVLSESGRRDFTSTSYNVEYNGPLSNGQTVYVKITPARLLANSEALTESDRLIVSCPGFTSLADGSIIISFDSENICRSITVTAVPDNALDDYGVTKVGPREERINDIDGAVYAYGYGKSMMLDTGNPAMLNYRHIVEGQGGMQQASNFNELNNFDEGMLFSLQVVDGAAMLDLSSLSEAQVAVLNGIIGTEWNDDLSDSQILSLFYHKTFKWVNQTTKSVGTTKEPVNQIESTVADKWFRIENASYDSSSHILTLVLNEPVVLPTGGVNFALISGNRDSLFVDEMASVDRLFVNNQQDSVDARASLTGFVNNNRNEAEKNVDAYDSHAVRFTHTELEAFPEKQLAENDDPLMMQSGITAAQMEYAEYNLGKGKDTVDINKTLYREDAYRTYTVVNTGNAANENAEFGLHLGDAGIAAENAANGASFNDGVYHYGLTPIANNGVNVVREESDTEVYYVEAIIKKQDVPPAEADNFVTQRREVKGSFSNQDGFDIEYDFVLAEGEYIDGFRFYQAEFDDDIKVNSYQADHTRNLICSGTISSQPPVLNLGAVTYSYAIDSDDSSLFVSWKEKFDSLKATADNIHKDAPNGYEFNMFVDATLSDGSVQRRAVSELTSSSFSISRDFTLTAGISIVSLKFAYGYEGDGQLVINAQSGHDRIDASSTNVTRNDMVVFGGLGDDTINMNCGGIAFGDRGQVLYNNGQVNGVDVGDTVLGSTVGDIDAENPVFIDDYTTGIGKTPGRTADEQGNPVHRLQTDGVNRDAYRIQSVDAEKGGTDMIKVGGTNSVVVGGAKNDVIVIGGDKNVALGDNGRVTYNNAENDETVYGDKLGLGMHLVETTNDNVGGVDNIVIAGDKNVAMGGFAGDSIRITGSDNVAIGDGGRYTVTPERLYAESKNEGDGGQDYISTGDGKNAIIGGTDKDTIRTGAGNDAIVGDGGKVIMDLERNALMVTNEGFNVGEDLGTAGADDIDAGDGDNVIFGGLGNDNIRTGRGKDVVFGDNGFATFRGNASEALSQVHDTLAVPEIRDEATLSFNFVGNSQTGLSSEAVAGALNASHNDDFRSDHWNNIGGPLSGTYGNDDREIVRFDDGTRASAVSVSYGGIERHRTTGTDNRINLQGYSHNFANSSTDANAALMNSGLMTTAPNSQNENKLEVSVDGLAQYFTHYSVIVYLDLPDSHSADTSSIRKVSLFLEDEISPVTSYFVNDAANHNFNGSYDRGTATSAELATSANYVVFDVAAGTSIDRFRVVIEEAFPGQSPNGKNLPGIAAIQVNGSLHAQDVAASSDITHGGDDTISTGGGDDIVVGGTGGDKITTYGDERYGIYDNDVVFGDNAKMVFTDRDNSGATASMLSMAESLDSRDIEGNYADRIITGNGNDVVVGGLGADYIDSGATADADSMLDGIKVVSFNFTRENATAVEMVAPGEYIPVLDDNNSPVYENGEQKFNFIPHETAGVVADNDWTNLYIKNNRLHIVGENENNSDTPVKHDGVGISLVAYDTAVGNGTQNSSLMLKDDAQLDGDTSNSRLFNAYYAAQQQQEIKLTLTGLDTFRTGSELGASAACDVYVYLGGDQQGVDSYNYLFDVCGRQPGGNALDQHYYLNDWTGNHFDGDYRQVTCSVSPTKEDLLSQVAPDMSLIGNYVVFRNVTSATFEVRIRNLFTDTNQWPLNLPVITAVQVVAVADRKDDIAIGGDHDKDLVFGDDARVTFDIDLPFARNENQADYANRAVEAQSIHIDGNAVEIPLDRDGKPVEMGDTILTGRDRDVIVGGDFGDTITMGDGDDVALGDNASLILEHNNPVGVFAPSVEIMLEQHSVNTSNGEVFLGNDNTQASQIQSKFENGGVPGVSLVASTNGGTDTFTDVTGKDWTLQQETSSTTESGTGGSTTDSGTGGSTTDSGTGGSTTDSGTGGSTTDSGTGDSTTDSGTEDDTTSDITVDLFYIEEPLQIQAGTKLHIVCTGIVPNPWWRPYVVIFPAGSSLPQLRYLTEDGTPGEIIQPENNEYRILIPEVSNGEVSPVIHVVSDGNGLINATMG